MARGTCNSIVEDEDNWLLQYLATTPYGSDPRIMSNPIKQVKPAATKAVKKPYSLKQSSKGSSRRKSDGERGADNALSLPDRVNTIRATRDAFDKPEDGHFVRVHDGGQEARKGKKSSQRTSVGNNRRDTLEYDDLEAVRERLAQATLAVYRSRSTGEVSEEAQQEGGR